MLLNLHVKNFALIDEADVAFEEGLNILTGETGAGKSILIDAVSAALGAKTSKGYIRTGTDQAWVELVFSVDTNHMAEALRAFDVEPDEDGLVIISKRITETRNINKINDMTVTAAKLRDVTSLLIDIHGQHEHQSLFHKAKHLEILDDYCKGDVCKGDVGLIKRDLEQVYFEYVKAKKELETYQMDEKTRQRELNFLKFEIDEIESAAIKEGEEEELTALYRRMMHARKIAEGLGSVCDCLGSDRYDSAGEQISRAMKDLADVSEYDDALQNMAVQMEEIESLMSDLLREVKDYLDDLTFEDEAFVQTERRLDLIRGIMAKYGRDYEAVQEALAERQAEVERLEHYEESRQRLLEEIEMLESELDFECSLLSYERQIGSSKLTEMVQKALEDLNFLDVRFDMKFTRLDHYTKNGYDEAEFLISTNPGEPVRPLGEVASGGELSRIMLAIKAVLADSDAIPTLIFDEIDTGISGRTAQKVSEKLAYIARNHQVLCITHLPQIAAMADNHFKIEKQVDNGKTSTTITKLKQEQTVEELARLLGGVTITDAVLDNAREMKALAKTVKYQ